ncbi:MAG: site-specific DNA-methyltransferase, partial [Cyanobacteria bacterium NC_groundwater_1444_Ag_S-0.65um_54_12]|nr:site-specific DNA-methyltransferase [Cyanobacteria bacterium NC_groundwater_1444_Ag_S-0.65um_54_12]
MSPNNRLNDLSAVEWVKSTKSWLICDGRANDITPDIELHPATFPPDLLTRFIRFFTKAGQCVLDPFVGSGSTLVAAYQTGRRSVGIELSPKYYANTLQRLARLTPEPDQEHFVPSIFQGDARTVTELVKEPLDYCITSPPYWNILRKSRGGAESNHIKRARAGLDTDYGDDSLDLGNIPSYEEYITELVNIFAKVRTVLRKDAYITIIIQNARVPAGEMVPIAWDLAMRMRSFFLLQQEIVWCQNQKRLN